MEKNKILVELQEWMGSDTAIANAAWTSTYDKDRREGKYDDPEKVANVVRMLIKSDPPHGVPLESVIFRFWIRMPIFTDRQYMTHRIQSANGLSGRYRTMPNDWFSMPEDVFQIIKKTGIDEIEARSEFDHFCDDAYAWYGGMIKELKKAEENQQITNAEFKRARESIRTVLPLAGMVERTSILNLRSFANIQKLRNHEAAQPEVRKVVDLMLQEVKKANIAPIAITTLEEMGWRI